MEKSDRVRLVEEANRQMASGGCFLPFVVLLLLAVACGAPKAAEVTERVEYRDRVEYVMQPADTSALEALLRCSEQGEVLIAALSEEAAKGARMQTALDSLGRLSVRVIRVRDSVAVEVHDTTTVERVTVEVPVEVVKEVPRKKSWFDKTQQYGFWLFLALWGIKYRKKLLALSGKLLR